MYPRGDLRSMLSPSLHVKKKKKKTSSTWTCSVCTFFFLIIRITKTNSLKTRKTGTFASNASYNPSCKMCGHARRLSSGSCWTCTACTFVNHHSGERCEMCETKRKTLTSPKQSDVIDLISSEEENSIVVSTPKPPPTQTTQPIHTTKKKRKRELYFAVSSTTGRVFVYVVFGNVTL